MKQWFQSGPIAKTFILISFFLMGCTTQRVTRELVEVQNAKAINAKYLKVHLKNGYVYVLSEWNFNEGARSITGTGKYYDFNRKLLKSGSISVPYDQVSILETNNKGNNPGMATMVIVGIATVPLSIYCLVNPKACFGSCPTYYIKQDGGEETLVAEGFSSSICKPMEARDVDIIDMAFCENTPARIIVRNEALETHLIRNVNLLEAEKLLGERVIQEVKGEFYRTKKLVAPQRAVYNGNSIIDQISTKDHTEWFSLADSMNLLEKEDIFLEFENPGMRSGLVIDKRQSLMTTYLFYHTLSLLGDATGYYLAKVENGDHWLKGRLEKFYHLLGGIEVAVLKSNNKYETVGVIDENGPIASDMHLVSLPDVHTQKLNVRLRMTKGLWRLDMVNLATEITLTNPKRILPTNVFTEKGTDETALGRLLNETEYLVTYPGEEYIINYPVSFSNNKEYFIESQGYYIEWMREEWLQQQNLKLARKMLLFPSVYLKQITPAYKMAEPEMEEIFWNSRYPNNHEK